VKDANLLQWYLLYHRQADGWERLHHPDQGLLMGRSQSIYKDTADQRSGQAVEAGDQTHAQYLPGDQCKRRLER